jgi:elongation factor G
LCSAIENKGGKAVLDAVEALFPSPLDRRHSSILTGMNAPPSLHVLCSKRCLILFPASFHSCALSGTVSADTILKNMRTEENERLGNLLYLTGKSQTECKESVYPGAIVAVTKLKNTRTGDTLCDEKAPFVLPMPKLPPQFTVDHLCSGPREKGEEDKVHAVIQRLLDEDITLKLARDEESGDILLSGMGQLHIELSIELSVEKAKRRYKIDIILKTPKVPYRETVRGKCQVQGRHKSNPAAVDSLETAGLKGKVYRVSQVIHLKTPSWTA